MSTSDDFDILDWIDSGTVATRTVVIYNDAAVVGEFEDLDRRLTEARARRKDAAAEESIGDRDEVAVLEEQAEALYERWQASKAVWTLRALAPETIKAIATDIPAPARPDLPKGMAEALRAKRYQEFTDKTAEVTDERNMRYIAAAVVSIETPRGTAHSVTVDALRKMKAMPHGPDRLNQLITAVNAATNGDIEIPAPKSLGSSNGSQD